MCDFFAGGRDVLLKRMGWSPTTGLPLYFIDCTSVTDTSISSESDLQHGSLDDSEAGNEAGSKTDTNQGTFESPNSPALDREPRKSVRLLLLDIGNRRTPQMFLSKHSFDSVEAEFGLHPATIPCMFRKGGLSVAFKEVSPLNGGLLRVSIVMRSPHAGRAGIRFLSITHNCETQLTSGVLLGDASVEATNTDAGYRLSLEQVLAMIKSTPDVWAHPTFLATVMLCMRVDYCNEHSQTVMREFGELERAVGIADSRHVGALSRSGAWERWPESVNSKTATMRIHDLAYRIILMGDMTKWQRRCTDWLTDLENTLERFFSEDAVFQSRSRTLQDMLGYISSTSDGMEAVVWSMQQRSQMQINVLANAASQKDNQTNLEQNLIAGETNKLSVKIATSTKKDSIAMMAFTFITALFLPGTYVASLFSTGMFNWQIGPTLTDQETAKTSVSSSFWIYWAVSAPLTVFVMLGWLVWYHIADISWRKETGLSPE